MCIPGRGVKGRTFYFLDYLMGGHEGQRKEKRQGGDRGVRKRWPVLWYKGNIGFKTCLHLARRNVAGRICQETHS